MKRNAIVKPNANKWNRNLYERVFTIGIIVFSIVFTGSSCKEESDDSMLMLGLLAAASGGSSTAEEDGSEETMIPSGKSFPHTVGGVSFNMVHVEGKSFPTDIIDSGTATVSSAYRIAETEVTYELWDKVHTWATDTTVDHDGDGLTNSDDGDNDVYTFANAATQGGGSGDTNQHPVTFINWRDAMVWMNALTEYYNAQNGASLKPVYYSDSDYSTPIRTATNGLIDNPLVSGEEDQPYIYASSNGNTDMANNTADGFRLPTVHEWELAARYIDDANGDGDIQDSGEYYPGDFASGADAVNTDTITSTDYDGDGDAETTNDVSVNQNNSTEATSTPSTSAVKSKSPNTLGLYDMSGNVFEWTFDWVWSDTRAKCGGSANSNTSDLQVGYCSNSQPDAENEFWGLRVARSP